MRTIDKIITEVNCFYGAPMGRSNVGVVPTGKKIFDCYIPMSGGYDKGGAYWGLPDNVRVKYTKDLSYIEFYRPKTGVKGIIKEMPKHRPGQ